MQESSMKSAETCWRMTGHYEPQVLQPIRVSAEIPVACRWYQPMSVECLEWLELWLWSAHWQGNCCHRSMSTLTGAFDKHSPIPETQNHLLVKSLQFQLTENYISKHLPRRQHYHSHNDNTQSRLSWSRFCHFASVAQIAMEQFSATRCSFCTIPLHVGITFGYSTVTPNW